VGYLTELRRRGTAADYHELVVRTPYARFLGLSIDSIDEEGRIITRLRFDRTIVGNPNLPAIHGGVIGAFLEMAAIFQLVREGEGDGLPKPINFTIEYLRSAGPRDAMAQATITKHGRRVANVRVQAWQDDPERLIAAAHGHFLIPPAS
jgi:acyl-coenzyme A thioesterase PaaI-like protein